MSMSKKDFIALADVVREWKRRGESVSFTMVADLATFCKQRNSAFMRDRFHNYIDGKCGPSGGDVRIPPVETWVVYHDGPRYTARKFPSRARAEQWARWQFADCEFSAAAPNECRKCGYMGPCTTCPNCGQMTCEVAE